MTLGDAPYAIRITVRREGETVLVYRRAPDASRRDRLQRIATIGPLARTVADGMLRRAAEGTEEPDAQAGRRRRKVIPPDDSWPLAVGKYHPMRAEWGARLACLAIVSKGVRDHDRLAIAAGRITGLSGTDAAWWVGLLTGPGAERAARALRILTEAVA